MKNLQDWFVLFCEVNSIILIGTIEYATERGNTELLSFDHKARKDHVSIVV